MFKLQKVSDSDDCVFLSERCSVVVKKSDDDDNFSRTLFPLLLVMETDAIDVLCLILSLPCRF